jgi:hypothetical protein
MSKVDMSPTAITMRLERLSQMRELGLLLKQAGKKAGLQSSTTKDKNPLDSSENRSN